MEATIQLYMISGFLGSGKTTFLKRMIDAFPGRKVGVLINELGAISVDTTRVIREDLEMAEITGGSVYCACVKGDFIRALIEMSAQKIDVLLIENSGMADPAGIHRVLAEFEGKTSRRYHYRGGVCILDSVSFLKHVKVLIAVENQVRASGIVLVNKKDLVSPDVLIRIHETVKCLNPKAVLYDTAYADVPRELIRDFLTDNGYDAETTNRCSNKPQSYTITFRDPVNENSLINFLKAVMGEMYRIKGEVMTDHGPRIADAAEDVFTLLPEPELKGSSSILVLIGKDPEYERRWLEQVWLRMCAIPAAVE